MDILTSKERSYRMSLVRSKGTKPEQIVGRIIKQLNYKYRANLRTIPGSPDFVFVDQKKAIFVNGCFWHLHGSCRKDRKPRVPKSKLDYWGKKLVNNQKRDAAIRRKLKRMGWNYLVVWECRVKSKRKLDRVIAKIETFMLKN